MRTQPTQWRRHRDCPAEIMQIMRVIGLLLALAGAAAGAASRASLVMNRAPIPVLSAAAVSAGLRAVRAAGMGVGEMVRERLTARIQDRRAAMRMGRKEVCYDMVGCFMAPLNKHSPLKKLPQSPQSVDTKFWLLTRSNATHIPQRLRYGDDLRSLLDSDFDPTKPTKVLVHGFKGSAHDDGALAGAAAFLKLEDVNMVLVDWEKGASSPYTTAAANTELIGRQVGLLLLDMMSIGADPDTIHVVGFSLGAHVAGCAGQVVKTRGKMIGRISGLDAASPLFRRQLLREASQKLDASDARFVDVVHTDGGAIWTDGLGLLTPLGHVDYYPNGGRQQPGCTDPRASVVVSHFEGVVNSSTVCSHARAWSLFLETIAPVQPGKCQFQAYPCPQGITAFQQGLCFPTLKSCPLPGQGPMDPSCGVMGMRAEETPLRGPLYLVTRDTPPYCGEQLEASVLVSDRTAPTRGVLQMQVLHGTSDTSFQMACELLDGVPAGGREVRALGAAQWGSIGPELTPQLQARISYQSLTFQTEPELPAGTTSSTTPHPPTTLILDRVRVRDIRGNSWQFCEKDTFLIHAEGTMFDQVTVTLSTKPC